MVASLVQVCLLQLLLTARPRLLLAVPEVSLVLLRRLNGLPDC